MTHSIKQTLLTVLVALVSLTTSAATDYDITVDGLYYKVVSISDLTCKVVAGDEKYTGDVVIPSTITYNGKTLSVTIIGSLAFYGCTDLTSVSIGNCVTCIDSGAFNGCTGLTEITIPNSVTSIGSGAFKWCTGLTSVSIGHCVTSIGEYAFDGCTGLTEITIPNSVTSIGREAFDGCTGLTSVSVGNSVTSVGYAAFDDCTKIERVEITDIVKWCEIDFATYGMGSPFYYAEACSLYLNGEKVQNLIIPDGATIITSYAFYKCTGLASVCIPNGVTSIGDDAFRKCTDLVSVSIPNSVTSIGEYAFCDCTVLTSVSIPNSVTSIGDYAFKGCTSLTSVSVGNGVKRIGGDQFIDCDNITQFEIGNNIMNGLLENNNTFSTLIIAEDFGGSEISTYYHNKSPYYFYNNSNLKTIISKTTSPIALEAKGISNIQYMNLEVIVPTESLAAYQAADVWKDFWGLKGGAEEYITGIENITIDRDKKPDAIYDLQGRKLKTPLRGLNIINGKKVVVK